MRISYKMCIYVKFYFVECFRQFSTIIEGKKYKNINKIVKLKKVKKDNNLLKFLWPTVCKHAIRKFNTLYDVCISLLYEIFVINII